jgi:hypothetical protein
VHSPTPQTGPLQDFFSSLLGPVVANEISERLDIVKAEIFRLTAQSHIQSGLGEKSEIDPDKRPRVHECANVCGNQLWQLGEWARQSRFNPLNTLL